MSREEIATRLKGLRRKLEAPFAAAKAAGNQAEMDRLTGIAKDIDAVLRDIALESLSTLAASLTEIKSRMESHTGATQTAGKDFGRMTLSQLEAAVKEIFDESEEEAIAQDSEALATGPEVVPARPIGTRSTATAPVPAPSADGRLLLGEAHLLALWKRSQFPIDGRGIIVFGLRGCRPVEVSGTGFADSHEIVLAPINYRTMNCVIGQWRPGSGLALFPGSTVPFGTTVEATISKNGVGVNQMGRGRYSKYVPGWHKRSEGRRGHWALLQECPVTIQRTGDDPDFDLSDRWEVGRIAGDNIHCAFHMGTDGNFPEARFSSAGCQTVAGTVKKGLDGSQGGPWRRFIAPFLDELGAQKSTEYVLFAADEAQQIIRTRYAGKSVILRFGSQGRLVQQLQLALNAKHGAALKPDGTFGPSTFLAVIAFQTEVFGEQADDGIVGPDVAEALGLKLPSFDFDDAIAGGPGHDGPTTPAATLMAGASLQPMERTAKLAWGKVTSEKHGPEFNPKVVDIANRLQCDPNNLMAVMAFETGDSFDPAVKNVAGSGAIGLIQFMPDTAKDLGTTTEKLAQMSGLEQLDFVERHFRSVTGSKPLPALSDIYMCVLLPKAVGKPESFVLFEKPSKAYEQNKGLDINKDGRITKAEATDKVHRKLSLGMSTSRFG